MTDKDSAAVITAHILSKRHQAVDFYTIFKELNMPDIAGIIKHAAHIESESQKEGLYSQKQQPSTIQTHTGKHSF